MIKYFFNNRIQSVILGHCCCHISKFIRGDPQGSILGSTLLLTCVNDVHVHVTCCGNTRLHLFADDAKLFSSSNIDAAFTPLQHSLDNSCTWANE
jgi:hypothetical protein